MKRRTKKEIKNKNVFVDSSAFFALFHDGDVNHREAREIYRKLKRGRYILITSNLILAETHQLLLIKLKHNLARQWLKKFYSNSEINIIFSTEELEEKARGVIYKYDDKSFSMADTVSFVIMEELLETQVVFAFDQHYTQKGLVILTPDNL